MPNSMTYTVDRQDRLSMLAQLRNGLAVIGPDRGRFFAASILAFATGLLETVMLFLLARLAVLMTSGDTTTDISVGSLPSAALSRGDLLLGTGAALVVLIAISFPMSRLQAQLSARAVGRLRVQLIDAFLNASFPHRTRQREGFFPQIIGEYCQRTESALQNLITAAASTCTVSVVLIGLVVADPAFALGGSVGLAVIGTLLRPLVRRLKSSAVTSDAVGRDIIGRVAQMARMSEEVTAFDVGAEVTVTLEADVATAAESLETVRYVSRLVPVLYQYVALSAVALLLGVLVLFGSGSIAAAAPLLLLLLRALTYIRALMTATQASTELAPFVTVVNRALADLRANRQEHGGLEVDTFDGFQVEHVSYEYHPGQRVLHDATLSIGVGEVVGIVGPSGGGKTTLSQVLLRLREPTVGRVMVSGVELHAISAASWARMAAFVPQDNKLIRASVADNIRFFRAGLGIDEIRTAARAAHVDDELAALPDGYDTIIGPGARELSGGQRQRLGIARALVGQPQVLVLDEPTSALDERSELLIRQTLSELKGRATVVMVAHRPATLQVCDRVFRVVAGVVAEVPTQDITGSPSPITSPRSS